MMRFEQFAALAHQNQNVAVARGAAFDADRLAPVDQPPHRARDALGQLHPRTRLADLIERRVPAFHLRALVRFHRLPDFDHTGRRVRQRDVRRKAVPIRCDAAAMPAKYLRSTAPRTLSPERNECSNSAGHEIKSAGQVRALEVAPHLGKFLWRGVLERIDRLFLVADRENRADHVARAGAGGEFGDQPEDDLPLLVAGVLRFVDQEMIDAEIELVMHPGGIDAGKKRERLVDQIVVIEEATARLFVLIACQHGVGDVSSAAERSRQVTARRRSSNAQTRTCSALSRSTKPASLIDLVTMDLRGARSLAVQKMSR